MDQLKFTFQHGNFGILNLTAIQREDNEKVSPTKKNGRKTSEMRH